MLKLYENIKELRNSLGLSQEELAKKVGYKDRTSIAKIEAGKVDLSQSKIYEFAKALNTTPSDLMGWEEPDDNVTPVDLSHSILIPVLGSIPAGIPIEAVEDVIEHIDIPEKWTRAGDEYFGLRVNGDSMYPLLLDGDTVVIRRQPTAETGDICACYVNGFDATLKRIKLTEGSITLKPENPSYPPTTYTHPGEVTIAGKVVELRRSL